MNLEKHTQIEKKHKFEKGQEIPRVFMNLKSTWIHGKFVNLENL